MLNQKEVRRQLTPGKVHRIKEAAGSKCEKCKDDGHDVHHIIPVEEGGQNFEDNLIVLCASCHRKVDIGKIMDGALINIVNKRTSEHKHQIEIALDNVRPKKNNDFQNTSSSVDRNNSINKNDFVPELSGVHPKINTIKMQVCKGLLEGKSVTQLSKIIYPNREQDRNTYYLMYRQVQEVEKDGLIKVVQRPTGELDYTDIKIEETTNGVFGLKKTNKIVTNENLNMREQAIYAVCNEGLSFEQAAIKYDHQGDGERDGRQKVGNLVKRHIKLSIDKGTVIDNGNDTYSRV